jgi:signal transduction histidine kinase
MESLMQSLRSRLIVLIALLGVAGLAAGALMIGLFYQSASAQAGEAEAQIARACDSIAATYRFYTTQWSGPSTSLQDAGLRASLTSVVQTALRDRPGIEGGLWQSGAGPVAYAYPTYQGGGPKTDMPQAEFSRIQSINAAAQTEDRQVSRQYRAPTQVLLLAACPLRGPIPQLTAWTMTRVVTFAGRAYQQLMAGLGVLLAAVTVAAILLVRVTVNWSRHVGRIEKALQTNDLMRLPPIEATGEKELDQIIDALNLAGRRLADTTNRAEQLAHQVASGERLAAIGRVAAGVAHEIRNPIAAMRLKAENALLAEAPRQREALSMILGQIERLDRLLKRLLSLTERDPPRRQTSSVRAIIEAPVREHFELASARRVRIETRIEAETATLDAEQIRRAVDNLLLNAIEAAPINSAILVSAQLQGDKLKITVHDEGAGPPPTIRDHLFEPFVTGRPDGTGLGLSLVREIANAHGGAARMARDASGTSFEILIPWQ